VVAAPLDLLFDPPHAAASSVAPVPPIIPRKPRRPRWILPAPRRLIPCDVRLPIIQPLLLAGSRTGFDRLVLALWDPFPWAGQRQGKDKRSYRDAKWGE